MGKKGTAHVFAAPVPRIVNAAEKDGRLNRRSVMLSSNSSCPRNQYCVRVRLRKIIKLRRRSRRASPLKWLRLRPQGPLLLLVIAAGIIWLGSTRDQNAAAEAVVCYEPYVIDGDTFDCGGQRIRLASIDAPEMPGHCRAGRDCTPGDPFAAKHHLIEITRDPVTCRAVEKDSYGRTVARCEANGRDLSCAMIEGGFAVMRYGSQFCGG